MHSSANIDYGYLRRLVLKHSQNVLDPSRDYLFQSRLTKLLRNQGIGQLEELVEYLKFRGSATLERSVAEAMTINETSFFRDGHPFELLRTRLLPELIERRRTECALRFWSAACSTGQEAYSLAMLIRENFPALNRWKTRIEGTDISSEVVERAQAGRYHRIEMNRGLPARFVVRYFDHGGEEWTVKPEIRKMCNFRQANLCSPPLPFNGDEERFDVIFLRNVMLYFSQETRKTLMAGIHRLLAPDGFLFLGASEQPADLTIWTPMLENGTCYFRPRQPS
jgi:chemotaxis protein methyltransferase CheR